MTPYDFCARHEGLREIPGPKTNPLITRMYRAIGARNWQHLDDGVYHWCAVTVHWCLISTGYKTLSDQVAGNRFLARSFEAYGVGTRVGGNEAVPDILPGDLLIFWRGIRDNGVNGHIGFATGRYDAKRIEVLGGNQSNAIARKWYPRRKLISIRRLPGQAIAAPPPVDVITQAMLRRAAGRRRRHVLHAEMARWCTVYFPQFGITTPERMAAFAAVSVTESAGFTALEENLNYRSAGRVRRVFRYYRKRPHEAHGDVGRPETIAGKAYGPFPGRGAALGNTNPGDGWRFRGRGLWGLTGRSNYARLSRQTGLDFVKHPELLAQPQYAVLSACHFFARSGCGPLADRGDIEAVRLKVSGGSRLGMHSVKQSYVRCRRIFRNVRLDALPPVRDPARSKFKSGPGSSTVTAGTAAAAALSLAWWQGFGMGALAVAGACLAAALLWRYRRHFKRFAGPAVL